MHCQTIDSLVHTYLLVGVYRVTGGTASFELSQHKSYTVLINGIPGAVITFSYAKYARRHFERGTTTPHTDRRARSCTHLHFHSDDRPDATCATWYKIGNRS